ncbi:MraW methylase family-domain-containing protein [Endogone sp. FLAS-F59071]|nr:MraW methylase family-domain-containing protein [Endogone sp. FLAS-F59071]|eukprot:RUS22203.1 MraW methylase family-domain-containing protein [Endogone sp. FLAS-F59071]
MQTLRKSVMLYPQSDNNQETRNPGATKILLACFSRRNDARDRIIFQSHHVAHPHPGLHYTFVAHTRSPPRSLAAAAAARGRGLLRCYIWRRRVHASRAGQLRLQGRCGGPGSDGGEAGKVGQTISGARQVWRHLAPGDGKPRLEVGDPTQRSIASDSRSLDLSLTSNFYPSIPCFHGMLFDIGVSSAQLETPSRGFSYRLDGPLDMRMFSRGAPMDDGHASPVEDEEQRLLKGSITAYEVVNFFPQEQLSDIIYQYGEERFSRKIAAAIVQARQEQPLATTSELAAIIQGAVPAPRWYRSDDDMLRNSAARTFQAIRIYVNNELEQLRNALRASEHLLHVGGRLLVVTFHSLEDHNDRPTNQFALKRAAYRGRAGFAQGSDHQQAVWAEEPSFELLGHKVIQAGEEERERNARSRSAKLRGAVRTGARPVEPFGPVQ